MTFSHVRAGRRALVVFLCALITVAPASAAVRRVDDDGRQRPNAPFTSIQAAIDAARPGDTIQVYPGAYNEAVTVNKRLTVRGSLKPIDARTREEVTPNPDRDAIVTPPPGLAGFTLTADRVDLERFVVSGAVSAPGIATAPNVSGFDIRDNDIRQNTLGMYLNSSGGRFSVVRRNLFLNNNTEGASSGDGIYSDAGARNITIDSNEFRGHQSAAVVFAGAFGSQSRVALIGNTSTDDATFAALFNVINGAVLFNTLQDTDSGNDPEQGAGIYLGGGNDRVRVLGNEITGGASGGIYVESALGDNAGIELLDNTISGRDQGLTILEENAGGALARGNRTTANRDAGIYLGPLTMGNVIENNRSTGNGRFDCEDDSMGGQPGGVANFWRGNHGNTENRPGLCRPA